MAYDLFLYKFGLKNFTRGISSCLLSANMASGIVSASIPGFLQDFIINYYLHMENISSPCLLVWCLRRLNGVLAQKSQMLQLKLEQTKFYFYSPF